MSVYPELDSLDLSELKSRWHEPSPDGEAYEIGYYDELAYKISEQGGKEFLLQTVHQADLPRLAAILSHLPLDSRLDTVAYLQHEQPLIVARAIDRLLLDHKGQPLSPGIIHQVLALRSHSSPDIRGAVLRFVSQITPELALPILIEGLHDPDYLVRMGAIDELDTLSGAEALATIQPLLNDPHEFVREAASSAIAHLTQQSANQPVSSF
jgi:HEAT repeat protein